jgi:hypothetical protein
VYASVLCTALLAVLRVFQANVSSSSLVSIQGILRQTPNLHELHLGLLRGADTLQQIVVLGRVSTLSLNVNLNDDQQCANRQVAAFLRGFPDLTALVLHLRAPWYVDKCQLLGSTIQAARSLRALEVSGAVLGRDCRA